jgi:serine/threonine protein kinase
MYATTAMARNTAAISDSQLIEWLADYKVSLDRKLGNGGTGDVYSGTWENNNGVVQPVVIKLPDAADYTNEARIMRQTQSDYVATLHFSCEKYGRCALVMEHMQNGSLSNFLKSGQKINEKLLWKIALQLAKGIAYLHSKKIVHREINSANIYLDDNLNPKISNFSSAHLVTDTANNYLCSNDIAAYGALLTAFWTIRSLSIPATWAKIIEACDPTKNTTASTLVEVLKSVLSTPKKRQPKLKQEVKSWHIDPVVAKKAAEESNVARFVDAGKIDWEKVITDYQKKPVNKYEIGSVQVFYNPSMNRRFACQMEALQNRAKNKVFDPKWQTMNDAEWRQEIINQWKELAALHADSNYKNVKILSGFHGTSPAVAASILESGYANLATTDEGFFGKGYYFTPDAEYANRVYGKGCLIYNYIATYSVLPVIEGDTFKLDLQGRANYGAYDAHYVPVKPRNPDNQFEVCYDPCASVKEHMYTEIVAFESASCLPRYLITLNPTLVKSPALPLAVEEHKQGYKHKKKSSHSSRSNLSNKSKTESRFSSTSGSSSKKKYSDSKKVESESKRRRKGSPPKTGDIETGKEAPVMLTTQFQNFQQQATSEAEQPAEEFLPVIRTLREHTGKIMDMLALPNNLLAVTLDDGTLNNSALGICNLTTGAYRGLAGHYNPTGEYYEPVKDLKLSYDKQELISISTSGVKFWDINTGDCRKELIVKGGNKIESLPNGYIAISGRLYYDRSFHDKSNIEIWNLATAQRITILKGYPDKYNKGISCLQLINEGKWLASGCEDGSVKIWDVTNLTSNVAGRCLATIQATNSTYDYPWSIRQLRNKKLVICLCETTVECNLTSEKCIIMSSIGSDVEHLANGQLVVRGDNFNINLLNEDFTLHKTLQYDRSNGDVYTFRLLDDGNLACEMSNNEIQILDLQKYALKLDRMPAAPRLST